jgi:adenosylmethionine-8-amino-7-oxononanoate aminotransferase
MSVHRSNSSFENDRNHFMHPFADYPRFLSTGSRFFERADGAFVFGPDGKRYLDGIGGLWCVNIGYGRKEMADAIAEQVMRLPFYNTFGDMSSGPAADLAAKLADLAPGDLNHVFYATGGSTAIDTAVRAAHYFFQAEGRPAKQKVIAREMGYHGSTYLGASITGIKRNHTRFHTLASGADPLVHYVSNPNVYRRPAHLDEAGWCDHLIRELDDTITRLGADTVACFIAEPIQGAGGVLVSPQGYHARALEVCRRHDVLYVSDEVVTAFGRIGHMMASGDRFGITPDMIVLAKGITSGYIPLGAAILSKRLHDGISQAKTGPGFFSHGFTYSGHPVACAAGLKNIEIMEREDLPGHVRRTGPAFREALNALLALDLIGDVRGEGFMIGVEIVRDKTQKLGFDPALAVPRRVAMAAYERGVVLRNTGDNLILSPPLVMTPDQGAFLADTIRAAVLQVADELAKEGRA